MSLNSYNQLITNISQITNQNINIDHDNVITIDTLNNQLGIKKRNPSCELDVSGKIRCNTIEFIDPTNILNFNNGEISLNTLNIQQIKSISNSLTSSTFKYNIDVSNIKSNNIDVSNININEHLDVSTINVSQIDVSSINIKNAAVCHVQAIHVINSKSKKLFSFFFAISPQVAAFKILNIIILFLTQIPSLYSFSQSKLLLHQV